MRPIAYIPIRVPRILMTSNALSAKADALMHPSITTDMPSTPSVRSTPDHPRDVLIRRLLPDDRDHLRDFLASLSTENRRRRFLATIRLPNEALLDHLLATAQEHYACAALAQKGLSQTVVAVARAAPCDNDDREAEVALTVADAWQGCDVGEMLLHHLADTARAAGLTRLTSLNFSDDTPGLMSLRRAGFHRLDRPDAPGLTWHSLDLTQGTPRLKSA